MHDFLLKCFQKNPDNRASSAELLQHPWILKNQKPAQPKKRDVKSLGKSVKK
jgi:serine/threonine protein kinase